MGRDDDYRDVMASFGMAACYSIADRQLSCTLNIATDSLDKLTGVFFLQEVCDFRDRIVASPDSDNLDFLKAWADFSAFIGCSVLSIYQKGSKAVPALLSIEQQSRAFFTVLSSFTARLKGNADNRDFIEASCKLTDTKLMLAIKKIFSEYTCGSSKGKNNQQKLDFLLIYPERLEIRCSA